MILIHYWVIELCLLQIFLPLLCTISLPLTSHSLKPQLKSSTLLLFIRVTHRKRALTLSSPKSQSGSSASRLMVRSSLPASGAAICLCRHSSLKIEWHGVSFPEGLILKRSNGQRFGLLEAASFTFFGPVLFGLIRS